MDLYIRKDELGGALDALAKAYAVHAPCLEDAAQTSVHTPGGMQTGAGAIPPKDVLFPRSETLYASDLRTGEVCAAAGGARPTLLVARPCDVRGIENLDAVFLEAGREDAAYARRREALTIVALACREAPLPSCFCESMGGSPAEAPGADALMTETEDGGGWACEAQSAKGEAALAVLAAHIGAGAGGTSPQDAHATPSTEQTAAASDAPLGAHANPPAAKQTQAVGTLMETAFRKSASAPCPLAVDVPDGLPQKLIGAFEDGMWERLSEACIGCGCCAYVCPTCYCFDLHFDSAGARSETTRSWDSCMFPAYTQMAGGHNPRAYKTQRLRNRYLHKLAYFDERYGRTLCVGCGRCIDKCPQGLDITRAIEWGGTL